MVRDTELCSSEKEMDLCKWLLSIRFAVTTTQHPRHVLPCNLLMPVMKNSWLCFVLLSGS